MIDLGALLHVALEPLFAEIAELRQEVHALRDERGDELLTVEQAAELLHTSAAAVRKKIARRTLPGIVRVGRGVRVRRGALVGGGR